MRCSTVIHTLHGYSHDPNNYCHIVHSTQWTFVCINGMIVMHIVLCDKWSQVPELGTEYSYDGK